MEHQRFNQTVMAVTKCMAPRPIAGRYQCLRDRCPFHSPVSPSYNRTQSQNQSGLVGVEGSPENSGPSSGRS